MRTWIQLLLMLGVLALLGAAAAYVIGLRDLPDYATPVYLEERFTVELAILTEIARDLDPATFAALDDTAWTDEEVLRERITAMNRSSAEIQSRASAIDTSAIVFASVRTYRPGGISTAVTVLDQKAEAGTWSFSPGNQEPALDAALVRPLYSRGRRYVEYRAKVAETGGISHGFDVLFDLDLLSRDR